MDVEERKEQVLTIRAHIRQQEASCSDTMRRYGDRMPALLQRIDILCKQFKFRQRLWGPVGKNFCAGQFWLAWEHLKLLAPCCFLRERRLHQSPCTWCKKQRTLLQLQHHITVGCTADGRLRIDGVFFCRSFGHYQGSEMDTSCGMMPWKKAAQVILCGQHVRF